MGGRLSLPSRTSEVDEVVNSESVHAEMIDELSVLTAFTEREVKQLWRLFQEIDRDQDGKVSPSEMITIPQLEFNPLGKRVVTRAMRKRSSDNLSFKDFALALSVFAPDAPYEQKLKLAFDMFDFDGDKAIGRSDLEALLRALLPEGVDNLLFSPEKKGEDNSGLKLVPGIAERVLEESDTDGDGLLNFEEFSHAVAHSDIRAKLTIVF